VSARAKLRLVREKPRLFKLGGEVQHPDCEEERSEFLISLPFNSLVDVGLLSRKLLDA